MSDPTSSKYIALAAAALYAGCSVRFLRRRAAEGGLDTYLVGGRRFTTYESIDNMMITNKNRHPDKGRGIRPNTGGAGRGL